MSQQKDKIDENVKNNVEKENISPSDERNICLYS